MPLYEYQCQKCGKRLEAIQKLAEEPLKICPHCGGDLKKLFSAPAIQFKGSGFYITDYARGSKTGGGTEGSGKSESSESSKKSEGSESSKKSDGDKGSGSKDSGSGGTTTPKSGGD